MKGVAVKDLALWRKNMAKARQADVMTEQLPATFRALEQFATGGGRRHRLARQPRRQAAPATGTPGPHRPARVRECHYGGESALPAGLDHPDQVDHCGRVEL